MKFNGLTDLELGRLGHEEYQGRLKLTIPAARRLVEESQNLSEEEELELREWLDRLTPLPTVPAGLDTDRTATTILVNNALAEMEN